MSLVERDDVPPARSSCSSSTTEAPRPAASRAMPQPFTPPPITARSKDCRASPTRASSCKFHIFCDFTLTEDEIENNRAVNENSCVSICEPLLLALGGAADLDHLDAAGAAHVGDGGIDLVGDEDVDVAQMPDAHWRGTRQLHPVGDQNDLARIVDDGAR